MQEDPSHNYKNEMFLVTKSLAARLANSKASTHYNEGFLGMLSKETV